MGKGSRLPARRGFSDAPHSIALRIGDEKVSTSSRDTEIARVEFTPMPGALGKVFSKEPDAVVRPATSQDAADAIGLCFEERTRVVPRGAATAGLGGAVPVRGGVVIDLTGLNEVVDLDRGNATAKVEAGALWGDVIDKLGSEGFAPLAYPSSACGSTVGGWVSSGGYGAGTLKHGNFRAQVTSLEVGLPSGFLVEATGGDGRYSIPSFAGTEGQIGIITSVTFPVKRTPEKRITYVIRLSRFEDGLRLCRDLAALDGPPHSVDLVNRGAAGFFGERWDTPFLLVADEGSAVEVDRFSGGVKEAIGGGGPDLDSSFDARELYKTRFSVLKKGDGDRPFYYGSVLMDGHGLDRFIPYIMKRSEGDNDLALECRVVDRGTTLVTAGYRAGGENLSPMAAFARVRSIVAAAAGMGGVPYGAGLWNSPYIDVILGGPEERAPENQE
jgi:FAD/FMN-containing dehydrogenase